MLTRLFIDNFRCFENFEYKPARKELILGANGAGKSSLFDALLYLRQFVVNGDVFDEHFIFDQRTRWLNKRQMTAELDVELPGGLYKYQVVIDPWGDPEKPRTISETVHYNGHPIFSFVEGVVQRFNDQFEATVSYDLDWHRSALATTVPNKADNQLLSRLLFWFERIHCFRVNPFDIQNWAEGKSEFPNVHLSNLAAWYKHLVETDYDRAEKFQISLSENLEGFSALKFRGLDEKTSRLMVEFIRPGGGKSEYTLSELSEGQRCLIALYLVLEFIVAKGGTVMFDEPDNFLSLREIQPWLSAVEEAVDDHGGQILIISHHPEIINQWAPASGVQFVRDGSGPVRVEKFLGDPYSPLAPSELIARGWDRD